VRWPIASALLLIALLVGCGPSGEDAIRDLCGDLDNLAPTFELVVAPPSDARLGEVRGALEKVAPALERGRRASQVPPALADELEAVEEALRDELAGFGDDEVVGDLGFSPTGLQRRLGDAVDDLEVTLGCDRAGA
jgi:hypothetical protein